MKTRESVAKAGKTGSQVRTSHRALQLWQEYERQRNVKLFFRTGAPRMAGADYSYESFDIKGQASEPIFMCSRVVHGWAECSRS